MLCHIKKIIKYADKRKIAIGSFNVYNVETIRGVIKGAVTLNSPVIIQISQGGLEYWGIDSFMATVTQEIKMAAKVPIAFHLDHGKNIDFVVKCLKSGFQSVHFDGSSLPLKKNIKLTKKVVRIAAKTNAWVQGEVGEIAGEYKKTELAIAGISKADADEVHYFCEQTGVNTIAAAVGTAHGVYTNEKVDNKLIKEIVGKVKKPFVLHGGSGVSRSDIKKAIFSGARVVNIGTEIKTTFMGSLVKNCQQDYTDPRLLLLSTVEPIARVSIKQIKMFNN